MRGSRTGANGEGSRKRTRESSNPTSANEHSGKAMRRRSRNRASRRYSVEEFERLTEMPESKSARIWQRQMSIEDAGVLEQRVYHIEKAVQDQATATAAQIAQLAQNVSQQIQAVQSNTGQQISALAQQISQLGSKLEERAKIQWPALAVMFSFLVVIGGVVWYPFAEGLKDARTNIAMVARNVSENYINKSETLARNEAQDRLHDAQTQLLVERMARIEINQREMEARVIERLRDIEATQKRMMMETPK